MTTAILLRVPKPSSHHQRSIPHCQSFSHASAGAFLPPSNRLRPSLHWTCSRTRKVSSCTAYVKSRLEGQSSGVRNMEHEARIRKHLTKPEFLSSSYDTAWVAMVPLLGSVQAPSFPQCIEWILQNQHSNGSWGVNEFDSSAKSNRDVLLSTLACVIALKKWNVGIEKIRGGLQFIGRNFSAIIDEHTTAPMDFNLTFSYMLALAIGMGLKFLVGQTDINVILCLRDMEIKRLAGGEKSSTREAYLAYVVEGLVNILEWKEVMKFQRKNGSLFNSPSATAAALVRNYDDQAFQHLNLTVSKFSTSVPPMYPLNIYYQLSIVDMLKKIGISRHFSFEIKDVLDMTYSLWLQGDEKIMLDGETCAMAFRILRMNGYDVSSDVLSHLAEVCTSSNAPRAEVCTSSNTPREYFSNIKSVLELYKASKFSLFEDELVLENIGQWSGNLLTEILCRDMIQKIPLLEEIHYAIKFPFYAPVDPLDHKWNIEHFDAMGSHTLRSCGVHKDLLCMAVEDFCISQSIYQDEVQHLRSWEKENRLGELQFARQKVEYCYLCATASISAHELSDARMAFAKTTILTVVIDDFFDAGGSQGELENLIRLVEKWKEPREDEFYSEEVKILFYALYGMVNQIAAKAYAVQNRDVTKELVETSLCLMKSMMTEVEWRTNLHVPTVEEYMTVAQISAALGPSVLKPLYFLGLELPQHVVRDEEYKELLRIASTCIRLMNDARSFERERDQGKLNSVLLLVHHSGGSMSIEAAKEVIQKHIDSCMRDLLRMVLREDSVVPRACKEIFWTLCKSTHLFYNRTDGFTSPTEMDGTVDAIIKEPLKLQVGGSSFGCSI